MNISYDSYRIFYYVAKYGSISQAAKLLMNSQPNLTRMIKVLESELGCPLFSRTHQGVRLTPEGERLYAHISVAIEQIEAGEAEITQSKNLQSGNVFVAAGQIALRCALVPALKQYRALYPGVHVHLANHSTLQAIAAVRDGVADFAVVTAPTLISPSLVEKEVKTVQEMPICGSAFSFLRGRKVTLAELDNYPLISLSAETKTFEFYSDFFAAHGLQYSPDIEASTADQVLPMVEAGLGIGFLPPEFIRAAEDVAVIDLEEQVPARTIRVVRRKDQPLSVAARELCRLIGV